jgi:hypothetical protein
MQGGYRQEKNKEGSYDRNGIDSAGWHGADANPRRGHEEWAFACGKSGEFGTIEPGKSADILVVRGQLLLSNFDVVTGKNKFS